MSVINGKITPRSEMVFDLAHTSSVDRLRRVVAQTLGLDPTDGILLTNEDPGHWRLTDSKGVWRSFTASFSLVAGEPGYLPGLEYAKDSLAALRLIAHKVLPKETS